MTVLLAAFHYLSLAVGFAGLVIRGAEFKRLGRSPSESGLRRLYMGDNLWGIAALVWIATGLIRAFGGFEKGTAYYLNSHWFWLKMTLFGLIFVLEIWPMVKLIQWRIAKKTTLTPADRTLLSRFFVMNLAELHLIVLIVFVASAMARGGFR